MGNLSSKKGGNIAAIDKVYDISIQKNYADSTPDKLTFLSDSTFENIVFLHTQVPKGLHITNKVITNKVGNTYPTSMTCTIKNKKTNETNYISIILNIENSSIYKNKEELLYENSFDGDKIKIVIRYDNVYKIKYILVKIYDFRY